MSLFVILISCTCNMKILFEDLLVLLLRFLEKCLLDTSWSSDTMIIIIANTRMEEVNNQYHSLHYLTAIIKSIIVINLCLILRVSVIIMYFYIRSEENILLLFNVSLKDMYFVEHTIMWYKTVKSCCMRFRISRKSWRNDFLLLAVAGES